MSTGIQTLINADENEQSKLTRRKYLKEMIINRRPP